MDRLLWPAFQALKPRSPCPVSHLAGQTCIPHWRRRRGSLGFALIQNHPFTDGNKRIGHAAMETFLWLNGFELSADVDEGEQAILAVATGSWTKDDLTAWVPRPCSS